MGWATSYIQSLQAGEVVQFQPRGQSMRGRIASGQLCAIEPIDPQLIEVDDIVLCKVSGRQYLHLVKAIQGPRYLLGNNRGGTNGWISASAIYGRCTRVE
jgi:hypothetical protein